MSELKQLRTDLQFLAERQKIVEDAVTRIEDALLLYNELANESFKFMFCEYFKVYSDLRKHIKSDRYLREALKETHKQNYEKFESLFLKIKQLFGEDKRMDKEDSL